MMRPKTMNKRAVGAGVVVATAAALTLAGDLNPPAGPVAPTMKTLDEIEPRIAINAANTPGDATAQFIISQPGSYYLTGNIGAPGSRAAIRIAANDVSIDLNGFAIDGAGSFGVASGITSLGTVARGGRIHNGTISNWANSGAFLVGEGSLLENLRISGNAANGVQLPSHGAMRRCTLIGNGGNSVRTFDSCIVEDCIIETSGTAGIDASSSNIIRRNVVRVESASTSGILNLGIWTRIEDNNVTGSSGATGISVGANSFAARNTVASGFTTDYSMNAAAKHGPIITADGDLSTIANADHPMANFVY